MYTKSKIFINIKMSPEQFMDYQKSVEQVLDTLENSDSSYNAYPAVLSGVLGVLAANVQDHDLDKFFETVRDQILGMRKEILKLRKNNKENYDTKF